MSRPKVGVAHVVLETDRMVESSRFMRKIGMRPIFYGPEVSVYEMRGGTHLILMSKTNVAPAAPAARVTSSTEAVPTRARKLQHRTRSQPTRTVLRQENAPIRDFSAASELCFDQVLQRRPCQLGIHALGLRQLAFYFTTEYSAPELASLIEASNRVCGEGSRKTPALTLIRTARYVAGR